MREELRQSLGSQADDCKESRVKLWERPAAELAERAIPGNRELTENRRGGGSKLGVSLEGPHPALLKLQGQSKPGCLLGSRVTSSLFRRAVQKPGAKAP